MILWIYVTFPAAIPDPKRNVGLSTDQNEKTLNISNKESSVISFNLYVI